MVLINLSDSKERVWIQKELYSKRKKNYHILFGNLSVKSVPRGIYVDMPAYFTGVWELT